MTGAAPYNLRPAKGRFLPFLLSFCLSLVMAGLAGQKPLALKPEQVLLYASRGEALHLIDEQDCTGGAAACLPQSFYRPGYQALFLPAQVLVDLQGLYQLDSLRYFDGPGRDSVSLWLGQPGRWRLVARRLSDRYLSFASLPIADSSAYLRLVFHSDQAQWGEFWLYGQKLKARTSPTQARPARALPRRPGMGQLMGINAFVDDPPAKVSAVAGSLREYHNWDWDEGNSRPDYQPLQAAWSPSWAADWDFDRLYRNYRQMGLSVVPCLQGSIAHLRGAGHFDQRVHPPGLSPLDPHSYRAHAAYLFQFAARYGRVSWPAAHLRLRPDQKPLSGLDYLDYVENANEPDKWWRGAEGYYSPFAFAALCSADRDGHQGALGPGHGLAQADSSMKLVMAGLARLDTQYIEAMRWWAACYRAGDFPVQVLNFHHYSNASGGQEGAKGPGISPEEDRLREKVAAVVRYRDRLLPQCEIWISEFGYDTNPRSPQAAPALPGQSAETTQAQWLCRSFLALAAAGVDRAMLYMLRDVHAENPTRYSSAGITREKWERHRPKTAFFYLAAMFEILKDFHFVEALDLENKDLRAYRFAQAGAKAEILVLWKATAQGEGNIKLKLAHCGARQIERLELQSNASQPRCEAIPLSAIHFWAEASETPRFYRLEY